MEGLGIVGDKMRRNPPAAIGARADQQVKRAGCGSFGADNLDHFAALGGADVRAIQGRGTRKEGVRLDSRRRAYGCCWRCGSAFYYAAVGLYQQKGQQDQDGYGKGGDSPGSEFVHDPIVPQVDHPRTGQMTGIARRHE